MQLGQEVIIETLKDNQGSTEFNQLSKLLGIKKSQEVRLLGRLLASMEEEGAIETDGNEIRLPPQEMEILLLGAIKGNKDKTGSFVPEDGSKPILLSEITMLSLIQGDTAEAKILTRGKKHPREIIELTITDRPDKKIIGKLHTEGLCYVVPNDPCIPHQFIIDDVKTIPANDGEMVVFQIVSYPSPDSKPRGCIVEALGIYDAPGEGIEAVIESFSLPFEWPEAVLHEASMHEEAISEAVINERFDARQLPFVTIDDEDASDFDDAIYCQREWPGWRLMVAIADVSHYVPAGSAVDTEAKSRGTSVYFPDRAIPMLPLALYKGLCSLDPGADRLCMICDIQLDNSGEILDYSFKKAVMRSHARLTYNEVAAMITGANKSLRNFHESITPEIDILYLFYQTLEKLKRFRFRLDLETESKKFVLDNKKRITAIVREPRTDAHRIIEECMILANTCAARFMNESGGLGLYRVHPAPDIEQQQKLKLFFEQMGVPLNGKVTHESLQAHLQSSKHFQAGPYLVRNFLHHLPKAVYSPLVQNHFGLKLENYTHFTSPIRRYSDLVVHRIISSLIEPSKTQAGYDSSHISEVSEVCNTTQIRAKKSVWLVQGQLMSKLAEKHINHSFEGRVNSVTEFGLFIEIESLLIEAMLHISSLGDEYFECDHYQLTGKNTGKIYRLGDVLTVKITKVNTTDGKVGLSLGDKNESPYVSR